MCEGDKTLRENLQNGKNIWELHNWQKVATQNI